jgi:hypothetical protein
MKDCLVKRLKGVVDNDSLLKLGEMRIKCSTAACGGTTTEGMRTIAISQGGVITAEGRTFKVKPSTGGGSYQEVTEFDSMVTPTEYTYIFPDGEYNISLSDKYSIAGLGMNDSMESSKFFSFSLDDLAYSTPLYYIFGAYKLGVSGELKHIDANRVSGVILNNYFSPETNKAFMNINILKDAITLTQLDVYGRWNSDDEQSYGSINNLKSPVLTDLLINNSKITGDINTMIQNMIEAGRTSGSFTTQGNSLITVNGTSWNEFFNSLPGTSPEVRFTIYLTAPNHWTAARVS